MIAECCDEDIAQFETRTRTYYDSVFFSRKLVAVDTIALGPQHPPSHCCRYSGVRTTIRAKENSGREKMDIWSFMAAQAVWRVANMPPEKDAAARAGLTKALEAGSAVLDKGGSAMDAVSAAIMVMENDETFNAGKGAVFTYKGVNELDASIMDGKTMGAGAVTGARYTKEPDPARPCGDGKEPACHAVQRRRR